MRFHPVDVQVATGVLQVEAWRAAYNRRMALHAEARRAASHFVWVKANYLTTTPAGRDGRARAAKRREETRRALAMVEEILPDLEAAAMRAAPAVFARSTRSVEAAQAYRAEQLGWFGPCR